MARLSLYDQNRVAPAAANATVSAPRVRAGEIASEQLQQAGAQMQRSAGVLAELEIDKVEAQNEVRVTEALTRAQQLMLDKNRELSGFRGANALTPGPDGVPPVQRLVADFDRELGGVATELNLTRVQAERFSLAAQPLTTRFRNAAADHELREADAAAQDTYRTAVTTGQDLILADPLNAVQVAMGTETIEGATRLEAARLGLSPETTELNVLTNVGAGHLRAVTAIADENPVMARDYFERHSTWMTPTQQAQAVDLFTPALRASNHERRVAERMSRTTPAAPGEPGALYEVPVAGTVTSDYGPRTSVRTTNGQRSSSFHRGVDIAAPEGTPVRAMAAGRVVSAGVNGGYGNRVVIEHGDGTRTSYSHLAGFSVKEGDSVTAGQPFAQVGSTGNVTGPHLHLGATDAEGNDIDPETLFGATRPGSDPAAAPPTRRQLYAEAQEEYGDNPVELAAARRAIDEHFSREAAFKREEEQAALTAAYTHIDRTGAMPPNSVLAGLPPGTQDTVRNYHTALTTPPPVRTDPEVLWDLAANPEKWQNMTPEEFTGAYGRHLSSSDLISHVGTLARGQSTRVRQMQSNARSSENLPVQEFGRAWRSVINLAGVRAPGNAAEDAEERQQYEVLMGLMRDWTVAKQLVEGRQLTEDEIRVELSGRLARLSWEQPSGLFGRGGGTVYATSYDTMQEGDRSYARERLQASGIDRPSEFQIYQFFARERLRY